MCDRVVCGRVEKRKKGRIGFREEPRQASGWRSELAVAVVGHARAASTSTPVAAIKHRHSRHGRCDKSTPGSTDACCMASARHGARAREPRCEARRGEASLADGPTPRQARRMSKMKRTQAIIWEGWQRDRVCARQQPIQELKLKSRARRAEACEETAAAAASH